MKDKVVLLQHIRFEKSYDCSEEILKHMHDKISWQKLMLNKHSSIWKMRFCEAHVTFII